jgi:DNA-binding CsgD family transcriptional regulator
MADDLVGRMLIYDGRIAEGLDVLGRFLDRASVENRSVLPAVLAWIIEGEILGGRIDAAVAHGEEASERSAETGAAHPWGEGFHAVALAMAGRLDEAEEIGQRIVRMAASDPAIASDQWPALLALGVAAMARERFGEAARHLRTLSEQKRRADIRDPRLCAHAGELVEALIGAGHLDDADEALVRLHADAERATATSSVAIAFRGQALLAAARGQVNEALDHARRSVERFDALPMPFERARTSLLLGQIHRRRKEKRLARQALTEALEAFETLGAPVWAERARAELARIPVRQAPTRLSPTEERIAALAAAGLTNREIAERTFVSPKTVEANLARAYRKLGIRTRAELGRVMADRAGAVET